ncbi:hypothetical protein [Dawidia soli]|uniref:hypothetical protein n=1 Tax=Dawidia soli TaxID=2782352 RepID=UPI0020B451FD|nr:hypothetical protein [Dawidia soli]
MRFLIISLFLGLSFTQSLYAQLEVAPAPKTKKGLHGTFFFNWGYHRDLYTNSTIRFLDRQTGNYDFTFYHARAKDQPDWNNFFKTAPTVPQYQVSAGYFFNDKHDLGIEISWNHLKYVVRDNQVLHMKGWIDDQYYDRDTLVTPEFVHLEHTNGNNYLMISLLKRYVLASSKNNKHKLSAVARLGGGALVPKTDSYIMGKHNDGPFRFSGWVVGTGAAIHYDFFQYFFLEPCIKESFAKYTDVKLYERGRAQHHFFSTQFILSAGFNIPTRRQS